MGGGWGWVSVVRSTNGFSIFGGFVSVPDLYKYVYCVRSVDNRIKHVHRNGYYHLLYLIYLRLIFVFIFFVYIYIFV